MFVQKLTAFDSPQIAADVAAAIGWSSSTKDPERLAATAVSFVTDPDKELYVSIEQGRVIGVMALECLATRMVTVRQIGVAPSRRRQGIGSGMVEHVAAVHASAALQAETDHDAVGFYRRLGFRVESLGEKYPGTERFRCTLSPLDADDRPRGKESPVIGTEVTATAVKRIGRGLCRIERALQFLDDAELWKDPNPNLVSVGNIVLHLIGNVSQHVLSGLGGQAFVRERSREFTDKPGLGKAELVARLRETVGNAVCLLDGMSLAQLERTYTIQGMTYTGTGDVLAVLEHFSYHAGQVVFAVKLLKNVSLGLSDDVALNR